MTQTENRNIGKALREMDWFFDGKAIIRWHADLYNPASGAFYYALSSARSPEFGPHLESTWQVLGANWATMSEKLQRRAGRWVQSLQDPATGFFCEPECGIANASLSKLGRDQGSANRLLKAVGMEPLYQTASQRQAEAAAQEAKNGTDPKEGQPYLRSKKALMQWLDSMEWSTGRGCWSAGNTLDATAGMIAAAGYRSEVRDYILQRQNQETGMWGPDISWESVGGAAKFSMMGYFDEECPYPRIERLMDSVLSLMEMGNSVEGAAVANVPTTMHLGLQSYRRKDGKLPETLQNKLDGMLSRLIQGMTREIMRYKKPDGGFGYQAKGGQATSQGMRVSLGLNESDVNGTILQLGTRMRLYQLAGLEEPPLWDEKERIALIAEKASVFGS